MTDCLHVVHKVEKYGDSVGFTNCYFDFRELLNSVGCTAFSDSAYSERFSCLVAGFKMAISFFKCYKRHGVKSMAVRSVLREQGLMESELKTRLDSVGGLDKVIETMRAFYKDRDKTCDYIYFVAW